MEKELQVFLDKLQDINEVLVSILTLSKEKKEYIILSKLEELDKLMQQENFLVSKLEKLEKERFPLQQGLAENWGVNVADLSASLILEKAKDINLILYKELEEKLEYLDLYMTHLRAVNQENNELINHSLDYISEMQAMFDGDGAGIYSQKGEQEDKDKSRPRLNLIDKKA